MGQVEKSLKMYLAEYLAVWGRGLLAACSMSDFSGSGWKKVGGEISKKVSGVLVSLVAIYLASLVLEQYSML